MEFKVTAKTDFMRVFAIPAELPTDFCFQGGIPVMITMVDWFNPLGGTLSSAEIKTLDDKQTTELVNSLTQFVKAKMYYYKHRTYLAITDFGLTFIIKED